MEKSIKLATNPKEILHLISTIISWTLFVLLLLCASFLIYYFVATKLFSAFGSSFEPKYSLYSIMSGSMTPNIKVYDVIVDVRVDDPEDLKIGDVITFISNSPETKGMTITHRIISIIKNADGTYSYQTKGDYNPIEDSGWVNFNSIIGKVALKIPGLGRIQAMVANTTGLLLIILCVALTILLSSLIKKLKGTLPIDVNSPLGKLLHKQLYLPYTRKPIVESKEISEPHDVTELIINPALIPEMKEDSVSSRELKPNEVSNEEKVEKIIDTEIDEDDFEIDLPDLK